MTTHKRTLACDWRGRICKVLIIKSVTTQPCTALHKEFRASVEAGIDIRNSSPKLRALLFNCTRHSGRPQSLQRNIPGACSNDTAQQYAYFVEQMNILFDTSTEAPKI